ncbi:MAG: orotate phosphoribosyltransferase [Actinomycetota bacterium]|nr:orotate phosphoribosyltransferase [Actinomycetota bacterium]
MASMHDGDFPDSYVEVASLDESTLKELLIKHLDRYSLRRGDFTLKSGRKSSWFIDSKATACHPQGMLLVGELLTRRLPVDVEGIGGLTMGADPVAFSAGAISTVAGRPLFTFSVRKSVKDHGGGGRIAGLLPVESRVCICEDTVTRGTSIFEAVDVAEASGAKVSFVTAIVDRGGTVGAMCQARDIEYSPLVTALELGFEYEGS